MRKISYTAVVLDSISREKLRQEFYSWGGALPEGWEWIAHHMTITLGALAEPMRSELLGKEARLTVKSLGMDNKAMAIGVSGCYSEKKRPHITLAVNKADGGKPQMSNDIVEWVPYNVNFVLTGIVKEITMNNEKKSLNEGYDVKTLAFYDDVAKLGGKIYQVGGAVRDLYLGKESKDLDILITGVPSDKLNDILKKYGKVDMVGASFGVIKFTPPGGEEIDIALPRTEKKVGAGYQGFDVNADHTLPIEKDLERRDFTINSIAKDSEGGIIDPYNGIKDLNAKVIRVTNPEAFGDDPLRMLRAIQFASRFDFTIEPNTFELIKKNADKISEISKERVLIEFDKIVHKGNPHVGAVLLVESGLYRGIFGTGFEGDFEPFDYVTRMSEFIFWLIKGIVDQPDQYFKTIMKGEDKITKEVAALSYLYSNLPGDDVIKQRWVYFHLNKLAPSIFFSKFVKSHLNDVMDEFMTNKYPASIQKLPINGNDLMGMGYKGQAVGKALMDIIGAIYSDDIANDKDGIVNFLKGNKTMTEDTQKGQNKVVFYDFDATIMDSPHPDPGKQIWAQKTGTPYPHKGWWGRNESLSLDVFDIQPNQEIYAQYKKDAADPNTKVVLLTNRIPQNSEAIKKVLAKHSITFDAYSYKKDHKEKGERIWDILHNQFPDYKVFEFYDDDLKHLYNAKQMFEDEPDYKFKLYHVVHGKVQK
jgi:tRNA nucleotidyltransferase/poly(A) polymerase